MASIQTSDFTFVPKVWADHVQAYFRDKLVFGALAVQDNTLVSRPGTTINFPFFTKTGAAEDAVETTALSVDRIQDNSFSATVKEIGKAIGIYDAAFMKSAADQARISAEIQMQMGRVMAEKVDNDLIAEVNTVGNYVQAFTAAATTDKCSIQNVLKGKIDAFGDRQDEAVAIVMHSQHYLNMISDSNSGFLKADANDPMYGVGGFMGRLLGMAVIVCDKVPQGTAISGKRVYHSFLMKPNAYGFMTKQEPQMEMDRDILARERIFSSTQWYAVKAFHSKVSTDDLRIARLSFATDMAV